MSGTNQSATPSSIHESLLRRFRDEGFAYVDTGAKFIISVDEATEPPTITLRGAEEYSTRGYILDGYTLQLRDGQGEYHIPDCSVEKMVLDALKYAFG